ncbi:hypothetical protein [Companilactobacillus baiquanensis]|uniref:FAD:protein FMN transferase n=1 Tax=Companilactobacillus baiquanensis TaxID=2486005 RepID=A0ABW1UZF4_9LACO|nr:hypothetical protein [Companilactobacillus baiquanensis]
MTETKYYFPSRIIEAMGNSFTVKLATKNYDIVAQDIFHQTCYAIEKEIAEIIDEPYPFRKDSLVADFENSTEINDDVLQSVFAQAKSANKINNKASSEKSIRNSKFDSLIKSWMVDKIFESNLRPLLNSSIISGISMNSGGDMKVATRKGDDFYWEIGIRNPTDSQSMTGYYLKNGSVSTSKSNNDSIQQATIFSYDLVEANIWSNTGVTIGMDRFSRMVWKSKLTGVLFNQTRSIPFRDGILGQA